MIYPYAVTDSLPATASALEKLALEHDTQKNRWNPRRKVGESTRGTKASEMEVSEDAHVQPPLHHPGMRVDGRNTLMAGVSAVRVGDDILGNMAHPGWLLRGSLR